MKSGNWAAEYKDCLEYIDNYWKAIIYKPSRMRLRYRITNLPYDLPYADKWTVGNKKTVQKKDISPSFIKLPHYYFVPNDNKFTFIYYWDSYFMFRGLLGTKREWLMREMVENFIYLFNTFHIIPNFSAPASMGRSQPPFFTSMILDAYLTPLHADNPQKKTQTMSRHWYAIANRNWLKKAMQVAKLEYALVWIDPDKVFNHSVDGYNLSRYGDRDIGYAHSSELESGWDMTSRFFNRCDQFLPIDLNSYLYKYETDFAKMAELLNRHDEKEFWLQKAADRKYEMNKYMWDDENGFFYDYGYTFHRISDFMSLASYTPMWAGYATYTQAKRMVDKLGKFETKYGLTITAKESLARHIDLSKIQRRYHAAILEIINSKQWDYPNIWSPLEYQTVIGLLKYGFKDEAKRIMTNSVKAHAAAFRKYHTFFEKLNGETGESGSRASYVDQKGFGWTNAVFFRYIQILDAMDSQQSIYNEEESVTPPYTLSILH
jgi:alpha,alpha-trehalase